MPTTAISMVTELTSVLRYLMVPTYVIPRLSFLSKVFVSCDVIGSTIIFNTKGCMSHALMHLRLLNRLLQMLISLYTLTPQTCKVVFIPCLRSVLNCLLYFNFTLSGCITWHSNDHGGCFSHVLSCSSFWKLAFSFCLWFGVPHPTSFIAPLLLPRAHSPSSWCTRVLTYFHWVWLTCQ